ncbi:ABC transporter six-transmembrane domain-containing protein [Leclercia sp. UBA2479]|uniref:ABC transporter six-transmembrane domain-containing protein n=1 Tax=Leclercia sp. UBA2479 TaxID=1946738 RepID=UPI00257D032D|nr:ABC transporter six-transmembrane domain-containing protein [Leclercia sp. UBA2479]
MQFIRLPEPATRNRGAYQTLSLLGRLHFKKLAFTFLLVAVENAIYLLYPLLAGIAINAIVNGEALHALFYGAIVFLMWTVGAARRSVDTRVFTRIYAQLAVAVILAQREKKEEASVIAARVMLSREFVDFFELHLPVLITSAASIVGAAFMLMMIQFWSGIGCIAVLIVFACFLPGFSRKNESLFFRLNNRLEKEITIVSHARSAALLKHYGVLAALRVRLSDREACGYLIIGLAVSLLFGTTIFFMAKNGVQDAGHIYAVMTYLWMFAMSLDDGPQLLEKYSQLKDIGSRVSTS